MATNDFEKRLQGGGNPTLFGEFLSFLKHNKKWWLLPIVIVMLLLGAMVVLSGSAAAPFIYTLI